MENPRDSRAQQIGRLSLRLERAQRMHAFTKDPLAKQAHAQAITRLTREISSLRAANSEAVHRNVRIETIRLGHQTWKREVRREPDSSETSGERR